MLLSSISERRKIMLNPPAAFLEKIGFDGTWLEITLPTFGDTSHYAFLPPVLFGLVCNHFKIGFDDRRLNTQRLGEVVEAVMNAAEHGNRLVTEKFVKLDIWLGPKGALFAVRDEGDFFKSPFTKEAIESRIRLLSTKDNPSGFGLDHIYDSADDLRVVTGENALYLLVLAESVVSTKGWGWVPARRGD